MRAHSRGSSEEQDSDGFGRYPNAEFTLFKVSLEACQNAAWQDIASAAALDLSPLRYFARAITPPGRTRRFDSRFFVTDAKHVGNLDRPFHQGTEELLTPHWFSFEEALGLDLPSITRDILQRLKPIAEGKRDIAPDHPVYFQYQIAGKWREETL